MIEETKQINEIIKTICTGASREEGENHEFYRMKRKYLSSLWVPCFGFMLLDYGDSQDSSAVITQPETVATYLWGD